MNVPKLKSLLEKISCLKQQLRLPKNVTGLETYINDNMTLIGISKGLENC